VLGIAGIASTSAQVYSVNAVGYINVRIPNGFSMVANQLIAADNKVPALFPAAPDGLTVYKWNPAAATFDSSSYLALLSLWSNPDLSLAPGEGAFVLNPGTAYTNTFVGEVPTGTLTTSLARGFNIASSQVPQSGQVDTVLGLTAMDGLTIYQYDNSVANYVSSSYLALLSIWAPAPPTPAVGEAFWVLVPGTGAAVNWTREFSIN
jgi:hypothetical protein